eukprot:m.211417 g.211417  ORF g.211417 m.211417 type:complete len:608 (-) comp18324_c0_seq1:4027-5850(-)
MKLVLVAGLATRLEHELAADPSPESKRLLKLPKALLPGPSGSHIIDNWLEAVAASRVSFSDIYIVTNADKFKYYERWATAHSFPRDHIINNGCTSEERGAVADLDLALRRAKAESDVMVVAGDMLFNPRMFDMDALFAYFSSRKGEVACYYELTDESDYSHRGIMELGDDARVTRFLEKPGPGKTSSRNASIVFYCFQQETLRTLLPQYLKETPSAQGRRFGCLMEWLTQKTPVYGMKLSDMFALVGNVGLKEYQDSLKNPLLCDRPPLAEPLTTRVHARVGIVGNPSDGFNGKTISLAIANYWAEVTIAGSDKLILQPHPLNDPTEFGSLSDLYSISCQEGYQGGLRLMQAACKRFYEYCAQQGVALSRRNFRLSYDTNIPRQVGLAGSSAIVAATIKCLMAFFHISDTDIPKTMQPNLVLSVERDELGITAGLQDRVIQVYGGLVYMDFSKAIMDAQGHGKYIEMDKSKLPQFWLAYLSDPSDSGKIHSDVKQRWLAGDQAVINAMKQFGEFADQAKVAMEKQDWLTLADIMDKNFDLRRAIYTDKCLGDANLAMIELARKHGSAAKFPGSGGAVIGLCRKPESLAALQEDFEAQGYVFTLLVPC